MTKPEGLYRASLRRWWEMKEVDFLKDAAGFSGRQLQLFCERESEKRLQQTHQEFFGEIDGVICEAGLSIEEVARKVNTFIQEWGFRASGGLGLEQKQKLDEFLAPIYVMLRKRGYNREDLLG